MAVIEHGLEDDARELPDTQKPRAAETSRKPATLSTDRDAPLVPALALRSDGKVLLSVAHLSDVDPSMAATRLTGAGQAC
jgi:hypothetical protein